MTKKKGTDWMARLQSHAGAIREMTNPFATGLEYPSPSANFIYGNTWCLPFGYTEILYGPPKSGKSVLSHYRIGNLHAQDPDAIAVKFDSEYRSRLQLQKDWMSVYGIDPTRLQIIETNHPAEIFDWCSTELLKLLEEGCPVRHISIDSVSSIMGRREAASESVMDERIGDHAMTVQIGMKRILPVIRKHNIALSLVTQVRAETDAQKAKYESKLRMNAGWGLQHFGEYFVYVEPVGGSEGRKSIMGDDLVDSELRDMYEKSKGEQTGHRIRVRMKDSTAGPKGRRAEFTFDHKRGIINAHEEVAVLGVRRGVVVKSGAWYEYGDRKWQGAKQLVQFLEENPSWQQRILQDLRARDLRGDFAEQDAREHAAAEAEEAAG